MNVKLPSDVVRTALASGWGASETLQTVPFDRIESLVREKYSRDEWNLKF
jgi:hypothetical protein